jgi:response regulator RpfG family c-di-GMP phosphodiesterase
MHDVGKIAIPDSILLKPGALTREERAKSRSTQNAASAFSKRAPPSS